MNIYRIPAGVYAANCYVVFSDESNEGIIVDPGGDIDDIIKIIDENKVNVKFIVLTHGHGDHIGGVTELKRKYNVPLMVHEDDVELLSDASKNLSLNMVMGSIELIPDRILKDEDIIEFGDLKALVIHTPGHTKGGICLKIHDHLITGDTLFKGSIGRSDLLGGDYETLLNSIRTKLLVLPDNTIVLPGHGQQSTIKAEKVSNPFLQ